MSGQGRIPSAAVAGVAGCLCRLRNARCRCRGERRAALRDLRRSRDKLRTVPTFKRWRSDQGLTRRPDCGTYRTACSLDRAACREASGKQQRNWRRLANVRRTDPIGLHPAMLRQHALCEQEVILRGVGTRAIERVRGVSEAPVIGAICADRGRQFGPDN